MWKSFTNRLVAGPAFLLLGQNYGKIETGSDLFLEELIRKYSPTSEASLGYQAILDSSAHLDAESALAWMDQLSRKLSTPDWLRTVAAYNWSGVYSSAIDPTWSVCFRSAWREINPVLEENHKPLDPRNRLSLHCTFLFGCVNRIAEEERSPLSSREWRRRQQRAVALARRLPEYVTPNGTLAIEGYDPLTDWVRPDDLAPIIDEFDIDQVHLFSQDLKNEIHPSLSDLVAEGRLVIHEETLASSLLQGQLSGNVNLGEQPKYEEAGRRIKLPNTSIVIPRDIWNQVAQSALVLDDDSLLPPPPISREARYDEFRRFLASSEGVPRWTGIMRGFAFQRHFQDRLVQLVQKELSAKDLSNKPVILFGPTGTGKTIGLASLAAKIRSNGEFPVVFIERSTRRPIVSHLDRLFQFLEERGAQSCLIVWDAMLRPQDYDEFLSKLTSRGRKVVLVGSSYFLSQPNSKRSTLVEADASLREDETGRFATFLKSFHPDLDRYVERGNGFVDSTFLVALYRLLPETRSQVRTGVVREVGHAEDSLLKQLRMSLPQDLATTTLAKALANAGIFDDLEEIIQEKHQVGNESVGVAELLTGLVMVPGRFGLTVPIELLVRAIGSETFSNLAKATAEIDIFRWHEDAVGNIEMGPRSSLEASLISKSRLGGAQSEVKYAQRLLSVIHDDHGNREESREVQFALDLLRAFGPQSSDAHLFAPFFRELSITLRQLREQRSIENPRLMLHEANLLREWVLDQIHRNSIITDESNVVGETFEQADDVLIKALDLVKDGREGASLKAYLFVELATLRASMSRYAIDTKSSDATELFFGARDALKQAQKIDPTSYYPLDVLAWSSLTLLESGSLNDIASAEIQADLLHAFHTADEEDFSPTQREKYLTRSIEVFSKVGNRSLADEAFAELEAQGSRAGYYIRALTVAGLVKRQGARKDQNIESAQTALEYLQSNFAIIRDDPRCLDLMLDLWWTVNARQRFFENERQVVGLDRSQWKSFLELVREVQALGESRRQYMLPFMEALALFHLDEWQQAFSLFKQVRMDSEMVSGRRRIIRSYLASTNAGHPAKFHGNVTWVSDSSTRGTIKGDVFVEEIRSPVQFFAHEFGGSEISKHDTLGEFHIAFNFLGPIADPINYFRH